MALVKINHHPLEKGFSNMFNEFFNELPAFSGRDWHSGNLHFPPVNIHETPEAYHLELSVPGRVKEDFKLNVENGLLTVSFEKKEESKSEDYKTLRREFSFRSFKRSFTLDENIDAENIQAKYENGLLKILVPRKKVAKPESRQINID